ncbi:anti-sigma factor domain-containing protein [Marivita sp. S2033]|uniref:anti-sigma factor n=1 Tax=Marivita sp. S2033 TaxID=3373187 RepID=UPI003981FC31
MTQPPTDLPPDEPVTEAAEYALGLLTDAERAAFEARLAASRDLQDEVGAWQTYLAELALAEVDEVAPPPQLRKRLEATLFQNKRRSIWQLVWPYAAGGAAAALVLWLAVSNDLLLPDDGLRPTLQAELAATPEGGDVVLTAQVDPAAGQVEVARGGATPPEGRVFELWLIVGENAPVSLGVLDDGATTRLTLPQTTLASLSGATLAITDEPPGGSPTGAPTGTIRAAGTLTSS